MPTSGAGGSGATVEGLAETRAKMEQVARDLTGNEFVDGMQQATALVLRDARADAPVDGGRLKNSLTAEVTVREQTVMGVVGTNVAYAPYMEMGTKPHWPPLAALETWAERHGVSAFLVALSISRKGTKARLFLQNAFESNQAEIVALIGDIVIKIVGK